MRSVASVYLAPIAWLLICAPFAARADGPPQPTPQPAQPSLALIPHLPPRAVPIIPPKSAAPRPAVAHVRARPRPPETPPLPAPALRLTLEAPSPDGPWTMREENTGTTPLRALADARLLAFEIQPAAVEGEGAPPRAKKRRPVRCALPSDMRPQEDEDRALVIPPGRAYAEKLDPRLFCFGASEGAALVAGANVVPFLGGTRDTPAVEPVAEIESKGPAEATVRTLTGAPVTIGPAATAPAAKDASSAGDHPLVVQTPAFADYGLGWEVEVPVTVKNESDQSMTLLFRPETVAFDVTGPSGVGTTDPSPTVRCSWSGLAPTPIAETYTHLGPKQASSITVLLSAFCPDDTLRQPGLYVVRARIDTRHASGRAIGVHTFEGQALASGPTRIRVRGWAGAPPQTPRPQLVPVNAEATPP